MALVTLWTGLGGSGLDVELSVLLAVLLRVASDTAAAEQHCGKQQSLHTYIHHLFSLGFITMVFFLFNLCSKFGHI